MKSEKLGQLTVLFTVLGGSARLVMPWDPFVNMDLTLISAQMSNYTHHTICDEITYPFPKDFIPHFIWWVWLLIHDDKKLFYVSERTPTATLSMSRNVIKCWYIRMFPRHYDDVIMGVIASQITSLTIVYSTVYPGADQSKHQSSASLAFVWGIHRGPVNSPHK